MPHADRVRAVAANYRFTMDLLRRCYAGERSPHRQFGRVETIPLSHDVSFYNAVLALDPAAAVEDVVKAVEWTASLGVDPSVHLIDGTDPAIPGALESRGLLAGDPSPAMVVQPIPRTLDAPLPRGASVRSGGLELAEAWYAALEGSERFQGTFNAALIGNPSVRIAVAELDGAPAAGAMTIGSDRGVAGVYAVATVERARRLGLGRAATWAAIRAAAEAWGSTIAVLEATEMGVPLYAGMGFSQVGAITVFSRPVDAPASPAATR